LKNNGEFKVNEKQLRRLDRKQLLELLLIQIERADDLERRLEEAEKKLKNRELLQTKAGSLAEEALKLSGIFEVAQEAADLYLENVKRQQSLGSQPKVQTVKYKNVKKRKKR
jgi:hypothetical protein